MTGHRSIALCALRAAWEHTHGSGTVIGLAPSATAAAELAASLSIGADTLAKWIHQSDAATAAGTPWRLRAGQLVIIDEAAMAPTAHLDALVAQAVEAGAKVVLVGDPFQLGSVDTGGAFALLVEEGHGVELEKMHRFSHDWEAAATRQLRIGDPACLDAYSAHERLHEGPAEAMTERAYRGWAADTAAGLASLLLAADRDTVTALNRRVRTDRLRTGQVDPGVEVALHDGTSAAVGDHIITRRNDRRLAHPDGAHVRNGDRWTVRAVHPDGSLDAVIHRSAPPATVRRTFAVGRRCDHQRVPDRSSPSAHIQEARMNAAEQLVTAPRVLLTVEDAARAMAVGRTTVYQLLAAGSLRSVKIGRSRRIPLDAIRDYVANIGAEHSGTGQ